MGQWKKIYKQLTADGIDVYAPAQHQGECITPYVVVKAKTVSGISGYSSVQAYYDLMCYIPKDQYSTLEDFVAEVKESMKKLFPEVVYDKFETESYYDESVKGHMVSIQYRNNRKL